MNKMTEAADEIYRFIDAINNIPRVTVSHQYIVQNISNSNQGQRNYESDSYRKRTSVN